MYETIQVRFYNTCVRFRFVFRISKTSFTHFQPLYCTSQAFYHGCIHLSEDCFILGFGAKISGLSGNVTFKPSQTATNPSGTTYASWLIQVPAIRTVFVTLTSPPKCSQDGLTSLHVYQGSTANGVQVARVCKSPTYTMDMNVMKGPFITLVLVTRNFKDSGFVVHFDVNRPGIFCVFHSRPLRGTLCFLPTNFTNLD